MITAWRVDPWPEIEKLAARGSTFPMAKALRSVIEATRALATGDNATAKNLLKTAVREINAVTWRTTRRKAT
jgi:hypothetical protein